MKKRMKKLATFALAACMFASITACGSNEQATKEEPVKEETVSVVSEVSTETVAGISDEDSEADKETEVVATSEEEVKEAAEVEVNDSKDDEWLRKALIHKIEIGQIKSQDKELVEQVKNFMVEPLNHNASDEELIYNQIAENNVNRGISAEKFEEIYMSINP